MQLWLHTPAEITHPLPVTNHLMKIVNKVATVGQLNSNFQPLSRASGLAEPLCEVQQHARGRQPQKIILKPLKLSFFLVICCCWFLPGAYGGFMVSLPSQ